MDYADYLKRREARMMRETWFYYTKYLELFEGCEPLLDIGCGAGNFLALGREKMVVYGLDFMGEIVVYCRRRGLEVVAGSIVGLPFESASLGGVFCAHVLEHLGRDELLAAAAEIERVLRPGGKAIIVVPRPKDIWEFFDDPTHVSPMTEKRVALLFNRFSTVEFVNYYLPFLKDLLTVRLNQPGLYDRTLKLLPFRGHTSITAVCVK